ncbi:DUF502 domain-containing protein [Halobacteriales archaeon Cl-PHB]
MATSWKRDFASGLIILAPLLVTAYIVFWLYNRIAGIPVQIEPPILRVALTMLVFVLLVFAVGYLMRTALGGIVEGVIDDVMNQLPGLRVVYNASKMAVETALGGTDELQSPVKLETWQGMRMTAFKTGKTTPDGRDLLFLPTAPNITTGFVIEVEPERYEETDETVEDALTRILSAGFGDTNDMPIAGITPDDQPSSDDADGESPRETDR